MVRGAGAVHEPAPDERARVAELVLGLHQAAVQKQLELGLQADRREPQSRPRRALLVAAAGGPPWRRPSLHHVVVAAARREHRVADVEVQMVVGEPLLAPVRRIQKAEETRAAAAAYLPIFSSVSRKSSPIR
jgi:hypothetical protein